MTPAPAWTFAMIDLAGFTALTESHGDHQAADLAMEFADIAQVSGPATSWSRASATPYSSNAHSCRRHRAGQARHRRLHRTGRLPHHPDGHLRHQSVDYWFCSLDCARQFAADPDAYADRQ